MQVIASGNEIDVEKFSKFALNCAKQHIDLYSFCPMTPTIHKILIHGPEIIRSFLMPIGALSEEAQEKRNKEYKNAREHKSLKISREHTNRDIMNYLLSSSDPYISSFRKIIKKSKGKLEKEAQNLLAGYSDSDNDISSDSSN